MNTRPFHSGKRKAVSPVHSPSAPLQKQILWGGVLTLHGWLQQLLPPLLWCRRLFVALQSASHMFSFVLYTRDMEQNSRGFCTHFADAETQTKRGEVTCPRSHSELVVELRGGHLTLLQYFFCSSICLLGKCCGHNQGKKRKGRRERLDRAQI